MKTVNLPYWSPYFAWLPVQLMDGRWAWLGKVERLMRVDECGGGYVYRPVKWK